MLVNSLLQVKHLMLVSLLLTSIVSTSQNCDTKVTDKRRSQVVEMTQPYSYIIQMRMKRGKTYSGTSFFIHPRVLLTAGHNIRKRPQFFFTRVKSIDLRIGATNQNTYLYRTKLVTVQNDNIYTLESFNKKYSVQEDYGIIILPDESGYNAAKGSFKLSYINENDELNEEIFVSGYPGDKEFCTQWKDSTSNYYISNQKMKYDFKTEHGLSGAPIWRVNSSNQYEVIGIHTNGQKKGCTTATIITKEIYEDIKQFCLSNGINIETD